MPRLRLRQIALMAALSFSVVMTAAWLANLLAWPFPAFFEPLAIGLLVVWILAGLATLGFALKPKLSA
jgi:hypothetical protein